MCVCVCLGAEGAVEGRPLDLDAGGHKQVPEVKGCTDHLFHRSGGTPVAKIWGGVDLPIGIGVPGGMIFSESYTKTIVYRDPAPAICKELRRRGQSPRPAAASGQLLAH